MYVGGLLFAAEVSLVRLGTADSHGQRTRRWAAAELRSRSATIRPADADAAQSQKNAAASATWRAVGVVEPLGRRASLDGFALDDSASNLHNFEVEPLRSALQDIPCLVFVEG